MTLQFIVRPYAATDRAFVADSWLNSLRAGTEESKVADWQSFKAKKNAHIDRILDDPRTTVRIAAPAGDDLTIYGYLVGRSPAVLHMLFVKKPFRRQGVASKLIDDAKVNLPNAICTEWTADLGDWILKKTQQQLAASGMRAPRTTGGLTYNPWEES